jgi:hypothetical protein
MLRVRRAIRSDVNLSGIEAIEPVEMVELQLAAANRLPRGDQDATGNSR